MTDVETVPGWTVGSLVESPENASQTLTEAFKNADLSAIGKNKKLVEAQFEYALFEALKEINKKGVQFPVVVSISGAIHEDKAVEHASFSISHQQGGVEISEETE